MITIASFVVIRTYVLFCSMVLNIPHSLEELLHSLWLSHTHSRFAKLSILSEPISNVASPSSKFRTMNYYETRQGQMSPLGASSRKNLVRKSDSKAQCAAL